MLHQRVLFKWSPECQTAFNLMKLLLFCSTVLPALDMTMPFSLEVDASRAVRKTTKGWITLCVTFHPVCYFSKKFLKHQLNYSTIEKETLALLLALQHSEVYLVDTPAPVPVHVYMDHNPLVLLHKI